MSHTNTPIYSPYGAYELKANYQRNFAFGTLITAAFVAAIVGAFWISAQFEEEIIGASGPRIIKTVAELGPPPTIAKKPPQVKLDQPQVQAPKVGIPTPVADDEVLDEDVVLATREEMADIVAPDIVSSEGSDIIIDIDDEDYIPSLDEFVPVEVIAEMIHQVKPVYPRLAKQAGLEGLVWIKALVMKDGSVKDAVVYKSSGTESLDEAAVAAAYKCKFKPGIQNGRPVPMWVTYKVVFGLTN